MTKNSQRIILFGTCVKVSETGLIPDAVQPETTQKCGIKPELACKAYLSQFR